MSKREVVNVLRHLAWWKNAIESGASTERAVRQLLLVNNAAALLEWHVLRLSPRARTVFGVEKRVLAWTIAQDLADTTQEALTRARKPNGALDETKAKKSLRALPGSLQKLLEEIAQLLNVTIRPKRFMAFEEPIKPAQLLECAGGLTKRPPPALDAPKTALIGPGSFVLHSLLPAIAAERLADWGELSPEALAAVRKECAGWLEDAIEIAATESKGVDRKRWLALGAPIIKAWKGSRNADLPG